VGLNQNQTIKINNLCVKCALDIVDLKYNIQKCRVSYFATCRICCVWNERRSESE